MEVDLVTGAMRLLLGNSDAPGNDLDNWLKKKDADQAKGHQLDHQAARGRHAQDLLIHMEGRAALRAEPGTPEFVASYNEAVARSGGAAAR
jgi:hypothetical protein